MKHSRLFKSAISVLAGAVILSCSASAALADDEVTLTIAARGGSHVDVINAVKDKFEKENNCTIKILGLENASLKQKVSLDSRNEEGAFDLVMLDDPWIPEFAAGGLLLNLTQNGYKDDPDFVTTSLAVCKEPYATGDTYALPFAGNVTLLFYNAGVLDKVGAKVPDNWQDVLTVSQKVKDQGLLGYLVRGQQGNPIVGDYLPILWAMGGDVFDKDMKNVTVNSQIAKDALALYIELYKTGANYDKNDLVASVSKGKAAMSLGWPSWFISGSDSLANYAVIPGKKDASSSEYSAGVIGNWMMGVTANTTHKDLAVKLLQYLTSAEVQISAADKGAVPTRTSVFNNADLNAKYPFYQVLLKGTEKSKVRPRTPLWGEIENVYGIELSNALTGQKSIDDALNDAKAAIEEVIAR